MIVLEISFAILAFGIGLASAISFIISRPKKDKHNGKK